MVLSLPQSGETAISNNAGSVDEAAATKHGSQADESLGAYQGDIGTYMSNVNSAIAAGNPYKAKDYLTQQNLATSGAMNAADTAAKQQQQQTVARTGTNTAALANEVGAQARAGQRDLTTYNATRDTENENNYLNQRDRLFQGQLEGANSEAGVMGTQLGAQSSNLNAMTTADDAYNQMWAQLGSAAMMGAGTGAGLAAHCWVAAELFGGWEDPRTVLVRRWVTYDLPRSWAGRRLLALYQKYGAQMARHIQTHRRMRAIMEAVFNRALAAAKRKYSA